MRANGAAEQEKMRAELVLAKINSERAEHGLAPLTSLEPAVRAAQPEPTKETINHPGHYNTGHLEVIEVIEDWKLGFHRGNAVKYLARAGKKTADPREDLKKALWYIERELELWERYEEDRRDPEPFV